MSILRMKGVKVTSLAEFCKNFDFTNAKDYLREGRLSQWVRELGESDLADELDDLKDADYSDRTLLDNFVGIFGLKKTVARLPETAAPEPEEETPSADEKHGSEAPIIYEGFFPDTHEEPTMENIDRTLRIKATLKIIGEQALLAIPPKMRALATAPIKITPDALLEKICPSPCRSVPFFYFMEDWEHGLVGALNKACGYPPGRYSGHFKNWCAVVQESTNDHPVSFETVGQLVEYLSTAEHADILKIYSANKLAQLNEEKF